jgi:hypothetical protein
VPGISPRTTARRAGRLHADGIEADLVGVLEHVEVLVVELVTAPRIVEAVRHVHPHPVVAFAEVRR